MLIRSSGPRDWRLFFANDLVVTLNGEVVLYVLEADDEVGYVIRYALDAYGKTFVANGSFQTERVDGAVAFTGTRKFSPDDAIAAAMAKRDRRALRNLRIQSRAERKAGAA